MRKFTDTIVKTLELEDEVISAIQDCGAKYLQNLQEGSDLFDGLNPKAVILERLQDVFEECGHQISDLRLKSNQIIFVIELFLGYDQDDNEISDTWKIEYYPSVDQFKVTYVEAD